MTPRSSTPLPPVSEYERTPWTMATVQPATPIRYRNPALPRRFRETDGNSHRGAGDGLTCVKLQGAAAPRLARMGIGAPGAGFKRSTRWVLRCLAVLSFFAQVGAVAAPCFDCPSDGRSASHASVDRVDRHQGGHEALCANGLVSVSQASARNAGVQAPDLGPAPAVIALWLPKTSGIVVQAWGAVPHAPVARFLMFGRLLR
jgi:hypothetical protein